MFMPGYTYEPDIVHYILNKYSYASSIIAGLREPSNLKSTLTYILNEFVNQLINN